MVGAGAGGLPRTYQANLRYWGKPPHSGRPGRVYVGDRGLVAVQALDVALQLDRSRAASGPPSTSPTRALRLCQRAR